MTISFGDLYRSKYSVFETCPGNKLLVLITNHIREVVFYIGRVFQNGDCASLSVFLLASNQTKFDQILSLKGRGVRKGSEW